MADKIDGAHLSWMAQFGTYVDTASEPGNVSLECGKAGCAWRHVVPMPFLLGDAVRVAGLHYAEKHGGRL